MAQAHHEFVTAEHRRIWRRIVVAALVAIAIPFPAWLWAHSRPRSPLPYHRLVINFERLGAWSGPVYGVRVDETGKVTYDGRSYVKTEGFQESRIDKRAVDELVAEAQAIGFFQMEDGYWNPATCLPYAITSIELDGQRKRVINYGRSGPVELRRLEELIDQKTNSAQWVGP